MPRPFVAALAAALCMLPAIARADAPPMGVQRTGNVTIVRQTDPAALLVGVEYVVPAGLDRQTLTQSGLSALTAESILRTPVAGVPLADAIAAKGGSVHWNVEANDVRFYVESLPEDAPAVTALFLSAVAKPDFSAATVDAARASVDRKFAARQQAALQVGLDMLAREASPSANSGSPELGSPASLAQLSANDAAAFYARNYRRDGSVVSAAGRVDALPAGWGESFANALPPGSGKAIFVHLPALEGSSRQFVTHRDIGAPWLIAQYPAPPIDSKDFGAMLVLSAFIQRTLLDVSGMPSVVSATIGSRAIGSVYSFDGQPPRLTLFVNGEIGNPTQAFETALQLVNVLSQTRLHGSIDQFKAAAAGDFAGDADRLESRASLGGLFAGQGASPDFLNRTLAAIAATTPDDVRRVAKKYLNDPAIALVLPRDNS